MSWWLSKGTRCNSCISPCMKTDPFRIIVTLGHFSHNLKLNLCIGHVIFGWTHDQPESVGVVLLLKIRPDLAPSLLQSQLLPLGCGNVCCGNVFVMWQCICVGAMYFRGLINLWSPVATDSKMSPDQAPCQMFPSAACCMFWQWLLISSSNLNKW